MDQAVERRAESSVLEGPWLCLSEMPSLFVKFEGIDLTKELVCSETRSYEPSWWGIGYLVCSSDVQQEAPMLAILVEGHQTTKKQEVDRGCKKQIRADRK